MKAFFKYSFLEENLNRLPLLTQDPKDIGHLRLPLKYLYYEIKMNYEKKFNDKIKTFYIVLNLNNSDQDILKSMI